MRKIAVSTMVTNLVSMVGVDSFLTAESTAAVRSFNRFGKLAWDRTAWPFNSVIEQIIPDLRVRSVQVGSGGSSYTSAPSVSFNGGGGNSAAATATINADGEVNGIAVTNNGTAFTGVPTVSFSGGGGSGATATASMLTYIDFGTTISEIFRVTTNDPYGTASTSELAFRNIQDASGSSEYGEAILPDQASNAPVWVHYRAGFPEYASDSSVFPYVFSEYAIVGAYGDWLQADGQTDKAQVIYQQAEAILQSELDKLERQEGQTQPIQFITYGTTAATSA
tara:strand:+ start:2262 stop:3101 length:840 start_codon:yes stop_codon:yes gene_type:complete